MVTAKNSSKIFIRNVTVLDCAVWTHMDGPVGRSWSVDVEWTGQTDTEGVVLDFSAAKKLAKSIIDEQFDHRLIISDKVVSSRPDNRMLCSPHPSCAHENRFLLETYADSLAIMENNVLEELSVDSLQSFELELAKAIKINSPDNVSSVKIRLNPHAQNTSSHHFNYLHSLRLHSGNCQRFHGHSNIIEIFKGGSFDSAASSFAAKKLNGKYLVADCYFKTPDDLVFLNEISPLMNGFEMSSDAFVWISYSGSQGVVNVRAPRNRVMTMPTESTIENIASWLHTSTFEGSTDIRIDAYEGHLKGAIFP
jgi:6-pyruvoyl-tetrahydropterin synthase